MGFKNRGKYSKIVDGKNLVEYKYYFEIYKNKTH